ncbi:MAG: radical SAM protein [Candidatus Tectimicrobiota bacterium]|nr:MAG: radical SAM protein [Candidatus Tectomicrobia bacterium]
MVQNALTTAPAVALFTRIQIQTVSWCNRSCAFCPSGKFPVPKAFMPLEVYRRVIDQLAELEFAGRLSPYLMNEPLLDKRLPELIAYARQRCPQSWIAINTNGDALSESLACRLFEAGLNCLDVNAYDSPQQHAAHLALAARVAKRRPGLRVHRGYLDPTFNGEGLPRSLQILHCRDMSDWEGRFRAKRATPGLTNRSGNVPAARRLAAPLPLGCPRPFEQMYINYLGQAVLCCNDWRFEVVMGDTAQASLREIWTNAKYEAYRRQLARQNRAMPLCATCDYRAEPSDWD